MKITICRLGKEPPYNLKAKGAFTKEFKDIEEIAKFVYDHRRVFWYPTLKEELSNRQRMILTSKLNAIYRKVYMRIS